MATTQNSEGQETSDVLSTDELSSVELQILYQKEKMELQQEQLQYQKEVKALQEKNLVLAEKTFITNQKSFVDRVKDRNLSSYTSAMQQLTSQFQEKMQQYRTNMGLENPDPNLTLPTAPTHENIVELATLIASFINS